MEEHTDIATNIMHEEHEDTVKCWGYVLQTYIYNKKKWELQGMSKRGSGLVFQSWNEHKIHNLITSNSIIQLLHTIRSDKLWNGSQ